VSTLVLDSQAFSVLARARPGPQHATVQAALRAAVDTGADVLVPAAVLAEQYRGGAHDQVVDSYLGRSTGITVGDTTRPLARRIGNLLARAKRGSEDHVDAAVVAVAAAAGGGVIITGDPDDLATIATGLVNITIEAL
jgi:predicted nucleic acid-binding protein